MQVDIEYRDFLLLLREILIDIKIKVIAIEIILISINLAHNSNLFNNFDLSKVQILIINISDLTFSSSLFVNLTINLKVKTLINIRVKILNQLSYFFVNTIIKMFT